MPIRLESLFVLVLLIVVMSLLSPYFLSVSNVLNILLATSVIGVLGFASTFVIAAAGIDLSLGSVLGFGGRGRRAGGQRPGPALAHRRSWPPLAAARSAARSTAS